MQASSSKECALPQLDMLPLDALLNIVAYLWDHVRWLHATCWPEIDPAAVAAIGSQSAAAAGAGGTAEAAADPAVVDPKASGSKSEAAHECLPFCLTADGRGMALSRELLQAFGALQQEDRPSQLLQWVYIAYEESSTWNSTVLDCTNELCTMCTAEGVVRAVEGCVSGQNVLLQRIEDVQRHQQALQQLCRQWPALEAELNAPCLTQETTPLDLVQRLLHRRVVLGRCLLYNSQQQQHEVEAKVARLEKNLTVVCYWCWPAVMCGSHAMLATVLHQQLA
ncbi:hypothetical protein COO60DRAFT_272304 [Scenedesmus sp. NREL 46B-D3]|nr:hypothetical protein COO60DRAFT_272304 [Scenedesmus sp. NREL 46B-D3]